MSAGPDPVAFARAEACRDVVSQFEEQVRRLATENERLRDALDRAVRDYQGSCAALVAKIEATEAELDSSRQREAVAVLLLDDIRRNPCKCDPPGSGGEFCTGHCVLRAELEAALAACRAEVEQERRWRGNVEKAKQMWFWKAQERASERDAVLSRVRALEELVQQWRELFHHDMSADDVKWVYDLERRTDAAIAAGPGAGTATAPDRGYVAGVADAVGAVQEIDPDVYGPEGVELYGLVLEKIRALAAGPGGEERGG